MNSTDKEVIERFYKDRINELHGILSCEIINSLKFFFDPESKMVMCDVQDAALKIKTAKLRDSDHPLAT